MKRTENSWITHIDEWMKFFEVILYVKERIEMSNNQFYLLLFFLSVTKHTLIGQFSGSYLTERPAKIYP